MNSIKLGTILKMVKGKKPKTQVHSQKDGLMPYCDIKAFETGKIDNYTDGEKCVACDEGDVLIVCDGARSGLVGFAMKGYVGSTLAKLSAEGVDNKYLFYFLQSKYTLLNTNMKGTGTPHVNQAILKDSYIYVPSIDEQQRIVARIEELFLELNKAEETLLKTKEQLEVYRQAVLSTEFENVSLINITSAFDITGGLTKNSKRKELKLKRPYLRVANVYYNRLDLTDIQEIGISATEEARTLLQKDDLLFVEGNGSKDQIGRVAVWDGSIANCLHQNHIIKGRGNGKILPIYAMYYLISREGRKQILDIASSTSGLYTLSINKIKRLNIPECTLEEQISSIERIENKLSVCREIEQTITKALLQSQSLRQAILKEAFTGKLV